MKTKYLLQFMLLVMAFTSCEKEDKKVLSDKREISEFVFKADNNESLEQNAIGKFVNGSIYVTLPVETDFSKLIPSIIYEGKSITPKNDEIQDFSYAVEYIVSAENDKISRYMVIMKKECVVTFDSNGGSEVLPIKIIQNHILDKPKAPFLESYDFVGWEIEEGKIFSFSNSIRDNITLKAKWEFSNISEDGNWKVKYDEVTGDATIIDFVGDRSLKNITVPATINGRNVVEITGYLKNPEKNSYISNVIGVFKQGYYYGDRSCSYNDIIETIDLTDAKHLKKIGAGTFSFLRKLKEVKLSNSVEIIDDASFLEAYRLESVIVPENSNLTHIGHWAFLTNYSLEKFDLYNTKIDTIGVSGFGWCGFKTVKLPRSLEYICGGAFSTNENLTELYVNGIVRGYPTKLSPSGGCFENTPIKNNIQGDATIYYPKGTNYPELDEWKDLNVEWVQQ